MQFNFSILRLCILAALLGAFWYLGGFTDPSIDAREELSPARISRAWLYCIIMFVAGASSVSIIDHYVGTLDRTNIRFLYILIGVALMIGGYFWLQSLREATKAKAEASAMIRLPTGLALEGPAQLQSS